MTVKTLYRREFEENGGFKVNYNLIKEGGIYKIELIKQAHGKADECARSLPMGTQEEAERFAEILYRFSVTPMHLQYILKDSF